MQTFMYLATATLAATTVAAAGQPYSVTGDPFTATGTRVAFNSSGTQIVGYHYAPTSQTTPVPAVLIAHGLGGLQTSRLQPFAQRFSEAGYHALTFDYRHWGNSSGEPRNLIDVWMQQDDYKAAIKAVGTFDGVDPKRVVLWGTSLSGGHVLTLGGQNLDNVVAVIAQAPHVNGLATTEALPPDSIGGLIGAAVKDSGGALLGAKPYYIPLANHTGELGALTQAGAFEGYQFVQPYPVAPGNVFPARFVEQLPFYNPDASAAWSKVPTFIGVGTTDNIVTAPPAQKLALKMGAELKNYTGGHFSVYPGAEQYEAIQDDQLAFLAKNVPL